MKKMKKIIALLLALVMMYSLVACGNGKTNSTAGTSTATETTSAQKPTKDRSGEEISIPENVEKIEIIPGGGSVLYGSGASGGVINVTTQKKAGNQKANSVFSEWNSDGYRAGVALSQSVNDQLSIQAGYTRRITPPSTFPYTPRNGLKAAMQSAVSRPPKSPACHTSSTSVKKRRNGSSNVPCVSEINPIFFIFPVIVYRAQR